LLRQADGAGGARAAGGWPGVGAMIVRDLRANNTLTERFGHMLYWLFETMARDWRGRGLRHVHQAEIAHRIMGLWKRFRAVVTQWEAGTLVAARGRVLQRDLARPIESTPRPDPPPQGGREKFPTPGARWAEVLPRRFGWLKALLLPENQPRATIFNLLLHDDADMKAIIAAAPAQIGRVLRPFCHLLGLEVPAELRLPKRRRVRRKDTSPRPSPHSGEGEGTHRRRRRSPREVAEHALRESERTGKPIDPAKIGAVAFGYTLHWPRDENCPPPEIGYGGRWRRPPKDYRPPKDWE
jgi:hypothetical protein